MRVLTLKLWNWLKWRRTYAQIWIYFVCTCVGILLISTLFLYLLSSHTILRAIGHYSETQLQASADNTEFMMNWSIDYTQKLSTDTTIKGYAFNNKADGLEDYTTWNRLNDLKKGNPYIESIYLINDYNQTVLDSNFGISSISEFYDQAIIMLLKNTKTSMNQLVVPRNRDSYPLASSQRRIITIIIPYEPTNSISAFVVNLNSDALLPLINRNQESKDNTFFIVNHSGVIVSSNQEADFLRNFNEIMASTSEFQTPSGWFSTVTSAKKQLVVHAQFSIRGLDQWKLIEFIPEKNLLGTIRIFKNVTLLFFIILLIGTLIVIRITSRKIYSPIQELVMSVTNKYKGQPEGNEDNELSYLSKVFTEQTNRLDDYSRHQKFEKRDALLKEILETANYPSLDQMQMTFNQFEILLPLTSLSIVLFRIDRFHRFTEQYSDRDQHLLRYAMANIITERLTPLFPTEAIDKGDDHIVVIYHTDNETSSESFRSAFQDCQELIRQYLAIETSLTTGPFIESYLELREAYTLVCELSNERFKLGWGTFIAGVDEILESDRPYYYPVAEEQQLLSAIRKGNIEHVQLELQGIWDYLEHCSYAECKLTITNLILNIGKTAHKLTFQRSQTNPWSLSFIQNLIERLEVMSAIYAWLIAELTQILEDIQHMNKAPKGSQMIQDIKDIIADNLEDQNLSTKWISDKVGFSVNYIRNVFKQELAQSIMDYISDLRLEKAKEQLLHTELSIDVIVSRSGFTSRVSFYSLFKKKYGTTPTLYRKRV